MKTRLLLIAVALTVAVHTLIAQVTNAVTQNPLADFPVGKTDIWTVLIAAVTPILVTLIYKAVPKIPKLILPASTPIIGILLGLGLNYVSKADLGWLDMGKAGALAVFVREMWNNAVTKQMQAASAAKDSGTKSVTDS